MVSLTHIALMVAVTAAGLALGSFLNVVIYRLPREGLAIDRPRRSFCPICAAQISWRDNIPVISWLLLRGRCRSCQSPISFRYPLVELLAALLAALAFQTEGVSIRFFITLYFLLCLVAIFFIDLEHLIIADVLVIPTILLGVILAVVDPVPYLMGHGLWAYLVESGLSPRLVGLIGSVAGFVLGFGILWLISALYKAWRGRAGLGDGDPPLLGLIGIYLGWLAIFPVLFLSTAMGLLTVGFLVVTGRMSREKIANQPIPFGPFLSLAAIIWYFFGQSILTWYLNLFT